MSEYLWIILASWLLASPLLLPLLYLFVCLKALEILEKAPTRVRLGLLVVLLLSACSKLDPPEDPDIKTECVEDATLTGPRLNCRGETIP
jgi:hypothetical protein